MKRLLLALAAAATLNLGLQLPAAALDPATTTASDQNYLARVPYQTYFADYLALRKGRQADLIFIGDSITEQFRWGLGASVWNTRFENRAFDFGLGADRTQHVLWRLDNFDLSFLKPKVAVIMIGTNNVSNEPEDIASGIKAVVAATQKKFAGVKVVVVSILPNARANQRMEEVNKLIAPIANGKTIWYLNLATRFTPEGDNWKGLTGDKLHLTTAGYNMWADELEALLATIPK